MPVHVVVIDNYDSFTYNLVQGFAGLGARVTVVRNDDVDADGLRSLDPDRLVISPGPGQPRPGAGAVIPGTGGSGVSGAAVHAFRGEIPILGVCLGHQLIGQLFGARLRPAAVPVHGKRWPIHHGSEGLFAGLPNPFEAARYHSLVLESPLPRPLESLAWTEEGEVMALGVAGEPIWGVQFHPESYLTEVGATFMARFLRSAWTPRRTSSRRKESPNRV